MAGAVICDMCSMTDHVFIQGDKGSQGFLKPKKKKRKKERKEKKQSYNSCLIKVSLVIRISEDGISPPVEQAVGGQISSEIICARSRWFLCKVVVFRVLVKFLS
jgi:hypothetical protein